MSRGYVAENETYIARHGTLCLSRLRGVIADRGGVSVLLGLYSVNLPVFYGSEYHDCYIDT